MEKVSLLLKSKRDHHLFSLNHKVISLSISTVDSRMTVLVNSPTVEDRDEYKEWD